MSTTNAPRQHVRALHHSWSNDLFDEENLFAPCVTIDPTSVMAAWHTLAKSTWEMEIARLPACLHHALMRSLCKEVADRRHVAK